MARRPIDEAREQVATVEFRRPDILEADLQPAFGEANISDEQLRDRLAETERTLHRLCDYSRTLWGRLDETRHYLLEDVAGGEDGRTHTMLTGDEEWQAWADLFAKVSSALAGVTGDSGFGRSEATLVARSHGVEVKNVKR